MRVARPGLAGPPHARARARAFVLMTSLKYGWSFLDGGNGGRQVQGERVKRKDLVRGPLADLYGSAYARAYSRGRIQGVGERFCFLVTFIWALGDVGVRTLHKSGVAVCECRHRDINPAARRLPSGYLLLLRRRLFFVSLVYFPNLFLFLPLPILYLLSRSCSLILSFTLYLLRLPLLRVLSSHVLTAEFSSTVWCTLFCI